MESATKNLIGRTQCNVRLSNVIRHEAMNLDIQNFCHKSDAFAVTVGIYVA